MNELTIFKNDEFGEIRTTMIDNEVWFVGKDIAEKLGYKKTRNALSIHVDEDDKLTPQFRASGQNRAMTIINESGVYSLILSSKLPNAKKFKKWVTSEVLPSIRKNGMYMTEEAVDNFINHPDALLISLTKLKEEQDKRRKLEKEKEEKENIIEELSPKASYCDMVLESDTLVNVTQISKDYGMSAMAFNKLLQDFKIQYKSNGAWHLYSKFQGKGYTRSQTIQKNRFTNGADFYVSTFWTQKGRLFLYKFLKENGIIPDYEKEFRACFG